jgi:hypothetical protein
MQSVINDALDGLLLPDLRMIVLQFIPAIKIADFDCEAIWFQGQGHGYFAIGYEWDKKSNQYVGRSHAAARTSRDLQRIHYQHVYYTRLDTTPIHCRREVATDVIVDPDFSCYYQITERPRTVTEKEDDSGSCQTQ